MLEALVKCAILFAIGTPATFAIFQVHMYKADSPLVEHQTGVGEGSARSAHPDTSTPGFLFYGPNGHWAAGSCKATFRMLIDDKDGLNDLVVTLDIYSKSTDTRLTQRDIRRHDFRGKVPTNAYQDFDVWFELEAAGEPESMQARVFWHGKVYVKVESVFVAIQTVGERTLFHEEIANLPIRSDWGERAGTVTARMAVDNIDDTQKTVAKISLLDLETGEWFLVHSVKRGDFDAVNKYRNISLDFDTLKGRSGHPISVNVKPVDTSLLELGKVLVQLRCQNFGNIIHMASKDRPGDYISFGDIGPGGDWDRSVQLASKGGSVLDSAFKVVLGLSGKGVSFESVKVPGHYLRHSGFLLWLHKFDSSDLFRADASFIPLNSNNDPLGYSFKSSNYSDHYISHTNGRLGINKLDESEPGPTGTWMIPRSTWLDSGAMGNTRRSTLTPMERRKLVESNMPLWFVYPDEPYPAKAWQSYLVKDIKNIKIRKNEVNLRPWDDTRHHDTSARNPSRHSSHIVDHYIVKYNGKTITPDAVNPHSAPTYVFYQEMKNGEVWIRYFLFFGYNDPFTPVGMGKHFADWVHIAVKLQQRDGPHRYIPLQYYYSAHADGNLFDAVRDDKVQYFKKAGKTFTRTTFEKAKRSGQIRVGAYLAKGNHEVYHAGGIHHSTWYDRTDIGQIIDPLYSKGSVDPGDDNSVLYAPYYIWDMSDVTYAPQNIKGIVPVNPPDRSQRLVTHIPTQLAPTGNQYLSNWFWDRQKPRLFLIDSCGVKDGIDTLPERTNSLPLPGLPRPAYDPTSVTSPLIKITEQWDEFEN